MYVPTIVGPMWTLYDHYEIKNSLTKPLITNLYT